MPCFPYTQWLEGCAVPFCSCERTSIWKALNLRMDFAFWNSPWWRRVKNSAESSSSPSSASSSSLGSRRRTSGSKKGNFQPSTFGRFKIVLGLIWSFRGQLWALLGWFQANTFLICANPGLFLVYFISRFTSSGNYKL